MHPSLGWVALYLSAQDELNVCLQERWAIFEVPSRSGRRSLYFRSPQSFCVLNCQLVQTWVDRLYQLRISSLSRVSVIASVQVMGNAKVISH